MWVWIPVTQPGSELGGEEENLVYIMDEWTFTAKREGLSTAISLPNRSVPSWCFENSEAFLKLEESDIKQGSLVFLNISNMEEITLGKSNLRMGDIFPLVFKTADTILYLDLLILKISGLCTENSLACG